MPFEDRENLSDLDTFNREVWFNDRVVFYGDVEGITTQTNRIFRNNSSVEVRDSETILVTANSVGIVSFTQDNVSIGNTVILQTTGMVKQLFENINLSSTSLTGTINIDVLTGTLFYFTSNSTGNWTFNIRGNATTSLNNFLPVGKSVTVTLLTTQGVTAYYSNSLNIDGVAVTPKWQEGFVPTLGYTNSINIYTYVIIKTANSAYTVIASLTKFS